MGEFATWLVGLIKTLFLAVWNFIVDIFVNIVELVLVAVHSLISLIPSPSFISQSDWLAQLLSPLPPFALFLVSQLHIPEALAIVGTGVMFNLARKLVTLGQW
jgi:hypothetical protein